MTKHRIMNVLLFIFIAGFWIYLLGWSYASDEEANDIHSREWVAQQYCGQNSVVQWKDDVPQCLTKHGKVVKVASK